MPYQDEIKAQLRKKMGPQMPMKDSAVPEDISEAVSAPSPSQQDYGYPSGMDIEALKAAQLDRDRNIGAATIHEGVSGLIRGISGANTPMEGDYYNRLKQGMDRPIDDILQQRKALQDSAQFEEMQAMQDPGSMQSQVAQKIAGKLGKKGYDLSGLPISQIKNVAPLMSADLAAQARADALIASGNNKERSADTASKNRASADESNLRKEINALPTTKATQDVSVAYQKIVKASENPSAAGDLSMIFSYMKILDPGSTVREGEQASASNAAGVPDKIRNTYNRLMSGERLVPAQRADFVNQAGKIFDSQMQQQELVNKQYLDIAGRKGLNPQNVVVDFGKPRPALPASSSGFTEGKAKRLQELRAKKAAGTLGK